MKSILKEAYKGDVKITEYQVDKEVKTIGVKAFAFCFNLQNVLFDDGSELRTIENEAFIRTSLRIISLPPSLERIGKEAFKSCGQLRTIVFKGDSKLKTIDKEAFYSCYKLDSLIMPNYKNVTIYGRVFDFSNGYPEKELLSYLINGTIGQKLKDNLVGNEKPPKKRNKWKLYTETIIEENEDFKKKGLVIRRGRVARKKVLSGKAPSSSSAKGRSHSWYNGRK